MSLSFLSCKRTTLARYVSFCSVVLLGGTVSVIVIVKSVMNLYVMGLVRVRRGVFALLSSYSSVGQWREGMSIRCIVGQRRVHQGTVCLIRLHLAEEGLNEVDLVRVRCRVLALLSSYSSVGRWREEMSIRCIVGQWRVHQGIVCTFCRPVWRE